MMEAGHRSPPEGVQRAMLLLGVVALLHTGVSDPMSAPSLCLHTSVNSGRVADCRAQGLRAIPEIHPSTQILLLTFNRLSAILNSSFPRLESLQKLSVGGQQGPPLFVGERAFQRVANITVLDLGGNKDLVLHSAALAGLASLEVLLLDSSGLDEDILELGYFQDLVSLRRLDLSGNRLQRLRPDPTFRGLERLSVLQLKLNRIEGVCGDDLRPLQGRHLSLLDLSSNRLSHRQACANPFRNITLGTLDVSSNPWGVTEAERFLTSVQGTRIQTLKMRHSGAIGRGFGFHNLKDLSAGSFLGLRHSGVLSLDVSHGFLNELVSSAFSALPDLRILLLRSNQISKIQGGAFAGLDQLHVLDLSGNLLGELFTEALQGLKASPLQHLILRSNHIGAIQRDALTGLQALQTLDLADNALSRIPVGRLPSLRRLDLGRNRIGDAWGIERLGQNLTHLDFSANRLTDLGRLWGQLGGLHSLRFLNLSRNRLSRSVQEGGGPVRLQELDLSHNELGRTWKAGAPVTLFQPLESLRVLSLASNALQALPRGLFQGLGALQALDLTANFLPVLPEGAFQDLPSLQALSLHGNPLMAISPAAFHPRVPLHSLDLQGCTLLCDCALVAFQGWLQSKGVAWSGGEAAPQCVLTSPTFRWVSLPQFLSSECSHRARVPQWGASPSPPQGHPGNGADV